MLEQKENESHSASALHSNMIEIISDNGEVKTLQQLEDEVIKYALIHYKHNMTQTAKALGIAKSTFYKKVKNTTA